MTKLTAAEIAELDVILRIPLDKWNKLPPQVTDLLRLFVTADRITCLVVRLPAYRWREVQAMMGEAPQTGGHQGR